jgi:hypothetical protein
MTKIVHLLIFGMIGATVFSQANNAAYNLNTRQISIEESRAAFGLTQAEFDRVEGSPYANENFLPGSIYQGDKLVYKDVLLRYNIFSDEIEIKKSENSTDESYDALMRDPDTFVKFGNSIYVFVPFEGSIEKGHYFSVVSEERTFDLYKKAEVTYTPPVPARTSYDRDRPAQFILENTFYLVSKSGVFFELPNSKSKIIKVMSKKEAEIKSYIKKTKLDFKNEKDLVKLVKYYNSLL